MRTLIGTLLAALGITACGPARDAADLPTLDEARRTVAEFQRSDLPPPPRRIDDLLAMLDGHRDTRSPERAATIARAEVEIPQGGRLLDTITALVERALAARALGRGSAELTDLRRALDLADSRRAELRYPLSKTFEQSLLRDVAWAELYDGNFDRAIQLLERAARIDTESGGWTHGRQTFTVLAALALAHAGAGDLRAARAAAARATAVIEAEDERDPDTLFYYGMNRYNPWRRIYAEALEHALLEAEGKWAQAEAHLVAAIDIYRTELERHDPTAYRHGREIEWVHLERAQLVANLLAQGRVAEAEQRSRAALAAAIDARGLYSKETAILLARAVDVLMAQGRFDEAEQLAARALGVHDRLGSPADSRLRAEARHAVAASLALRSRWHDAARLFAAVARDFGDNPSTYERFFAHDPTRLVTLARTAPDDGALAAIVPARELALANKGADHYDTLELAAIEAMAHARRGNRARALELFRDVVPALIEADRELRRVENQGLDRRRRLLAILGDYVHALVTSQAPDAQAEAFRLAVYAQSQSVQATLAQSAARHALADPELASLVRSEQDAALRIDAVRHLLSSALGRAPANRDPALVTRLRTQLAELESARRALRIAVTERYPEYARLTDPEPSTQPDVQRLLSEDEALIAFFVTDEATFVWAIRRDRPASFVVVDVGEDRLSSMVGELRRSLAPGDIATIGDIPPFDTVLAHELFELLLAPVATGWRDARSLVVIPHGPLARVPLAALLTESADSAGNDSGLLFDRYRALPWLARTHAVSVLPSATSLGVLRTAPAPRNERRPFVGFGDPVFGSSPAQRGAQRGPATGRTAALALRAPVTTRARRTASLEHLPPLPETAEELAAIAETLGANPARDLFLGHSATERAVKTAPLADYRVLAFATHGLVPGDLDGLDQPALALSSPASTGEAGDGLLAMDEVLGLRLDADWVLLSACNTGAAAEPGAEAISGLGRAFFFAGSRALLVSNWAVHSHAAKELTTSIFVHQGRASPVGRAAAVRTAMTTLIDRGAMRDPGSGRALFSYAHPIFWAAFSVVGDGR